MNMGKSQKAMDGIFEVVLNTVSVGITVIDKDLKIQYQNQVLKQIYGSSMIGRHCFKAYRGRKEPCEDCKIIDVLKDGRQRRIIRDVPMPNGDVVLVELNSAAIKDEEGNIIGAVEVARDVTEQKKAQALLNKTLVEQNEVLRELSRQLSDAKGYVKTVLPRPITSGTLRTDWRFIPSASLAGDSFGYHWIDEDHFAIYLLDVSGHGWGAALLSVSVINVLRSHALPDADFHKPDQVLFALNNTFPAEKHHDMFFTIWYGVYDRTDHKLVYASGGHPPALLFSGCDSKQFQIEQLRTPNFIMGGREGVSYQKKVQEIRRPSRLYVFTDGVYDITRTDGSIWGFNGLLEFSAQAFNADHSNLDCLLGYAQELAQKEEFEDDFTILEVVFE
jgi:sigma-B regulation protein RsbU (phosphoserine phosphatase)